MDVPTKDTGVRCDYLPMGSKARATRVTTLDEISEALRTDLEFVASNAGSGSRGVSGPAITDIRDRPPHNPGGVSLGVGLDLEDSRLADHVTALASEGYVALIYKRRGQSDNALRQLAAAAGVALFAADDSLAWDYLAGLVAAAVVIEERSLDSFVSVAPGDLFALANVVASLAEGAVAIADPHQSLLAYSTVSGQQIDDTRRESILQLHVPRSEQNDVDYRRVHESRDIVIVAPSGNSLTRKAVAIRAGNTVLGSLWLIDESTGSDSGHSQLLHEAANVAALHLLHHQAHKDAARARQIELVTGMLFTPARTELAAIQLGIAAPRAEVVAFAATSHPGTEPEQLSWGLRLFDTIRTTCAVWMPHSVCGLVDNVVYVVIPDTGAEAPAYRRENMRRVARHAHRVLGRPVVGGCSSSVPIASIGEARVVAEVVLAAMLRDVEDGRLSPESDGVVNDEVSLGPRLRLRQIAAQLSAAGLIPGSTVTRMREHDDRRNTAFVDTVTAYLECDSNAIETAARMKLHPNTVRYRLGRLEPLFGFRLDDPEARLLVWLDLWCAGAAS